MSETGPRDPGSGVDRGVDPGERARIERMLDRLEERLADAPAGLHHAGPPASRDGLAASGLPASARLFYARFDGLDVAMGEATILPLAALAEANAATQDEGRLAEGDIVVAERGRELFVLPEDPWQEGADVVGVDEGGDRRPEASTLAALALGWVMEASVRYADDGEFRDDVFDEDGTLTPAAQRRSLRRRLDADPDAPHARLSLAKLLLADGKIRGALTELDRTLRRAPEYCWAHHEVGRARAQSGDMDGAVAAHVRAAETAEDPALAAYFLAWAVRRAEGPRRAALAQECLRRRPDFVVGQLEGARHRLADDDRAAAAELVALGLAVQPTHVELLDLRRQLDADA